MTTKTALPLGQLVLLAAAGFLTMLTETVPAGLLPGIGRDLGVSDATTGQLLTAYAGASMIAAIPLVAATARVPRRTLILATVIVVAVANVATALSPAFWLIVVARLLGGGAAALQWALLAGYAMRLVSRDRQGRALSIAMGGIPLALAAGVPLGSFLGDVFDWRTVFGAMALIGGGLTLLAVRVLPTVAEPSPGSPLPWSALRLPGLPVLLVGAGAFQLGHMNLYTYVAPYLESHDDPVPVSVFLLVLGVAAIGGLAITGVVIDARLRTLVGVAMSCFAVGMVLLAALPAPPLVILAAVLWGAGLGASPTIFQSACARIAGPQVDQAQSLLVTVFNAGMALGSGLGGLLLARLGSPSALAWVSAALFLCILALLVVSRKTTLPTRATGFAVDDESQP